MNIEIVESEISHLHIITIDVDDSDDETLCRKASVFMQSFEKVMKCYRWHCRGVEDRLTGTPLLLDQITQQLRS